MCVCVSAGITGTGRLGWQIFGVTPSPGLGHGLEPRNDGFDPVIPRLLQHALGVEVGCGALRVEVGCGALGIEVGSGSLGVEIECGAPEVEVGCGALGV